MEMRRQQPRGESRHLAGQRLLRLIPMMMGRQCLVRIIQEGCDPTRALDHKQIGLPPHSVFGLWFTLTLRS